MRQQPTQKRPQPYGQSGYNYRQQQNTPRAASYFNPQFVAPRQTIPVTPGYTRIVGSYKRALPGSLEKKFLDTDVTNFSDVTAGVIVNSLNLVPQGTTDQTRIGNKIIVKNINIHATCNVDDQGTASFRGGVLRVILYVDKQANGATAAVTDILKTAAIHSFRNMDQTDRFDILMDRIIPCTVFGANALHTNEQTKWWKANKKCDISVHFSSTTGAITELKSNNVGLLYIADSSFVNAAKVGTARIKYVDA